MPSQNYGLVRYSCHFDSNGWTNTLPVITVRFFPFHPVKHYLLWWFRFHIFPLLELIFELHSPETCNDYKLEYIWSINFDFHLSAWIFTHFLCKYPYGTISVQVSWRFALFFSNIGAEKDILLPMAVAERTAVYRYSGIASSLRDISPWPPGSLR